MKCRNSEESIIVLLCMDGWMNLLTKRPSGNSKKNKIKKFKKHHHMAAVTGGLWVSGSPYNLTIPLPYSSYIRVLVVYTSTRIIYMSTRTKGEKMWGTFLLFFPAKKQLQGPGPRDNWKMSSLLGPCAPPLPRFPPPTSSLLKLTKLA